MADEPLTRSEIVKKAWLKRRATFVPPLKGKQHTAEAKAKMSAARKGRPSPMLGKKHTPETRAKISARTRERTPRGAACHSYKDGRAAARRAERSGPEVKRWRFDVMARDGFACVHCGDDCGGNLNAHHVMPWAEYPELRFSLGNGRTLCKGCHWLVHHYGLRLWSPL